METYEKKEKRQFNKYDMAIGLFYGVGIFLGIGIFFVGDIESDEFRELIVRWFQYGVFSPVMRLHGSRNGADRTRDIKEPTGGDNEIWSFGEKNLPILADLIHLRNRLIPYITKQMDIASKEGIPVMRPMFLEYPEDEVCYKTGDQYMFGEDILFAPISKRGQMVRKVYLSSRCIKPMVLFLVGLDKLPSPTILPRLLGIAYAQCIANQIKKRGRIAFPYSRMLGIEARFGINSAQQAMSFSDVTVCPIQIGQ